jgi:hypothetical protein
MFGSTPIGTAAVTGKRSFSTRTGLAFPAQAARAIPAQHSILGLPDRVRPPLPLYPQQGIMSSELGRQLSKEDKVNAWTQWGDLNMIMVGHANYACFPPTTPGFRPELNDVETAQWLPWPEGRKHIQVTDAANKELDNLTVTPLLKHF